jgi:hypothetical protein
MDGWTDRRRTQAGRKHDCRQTERQRDVQETISPVKVKKAGPNINSIQTNILSKKQTFYH